MKVARRSDTGEFSLSGQNLVDSCLMVRKKQLHFWSSTFTLIHDYDYFDPNVAENLYNLFIFIYSKKTGPKTETTPAPTFCSSLCSRNAHGRLIEQIKWFKCGKLFTAKKTGPKSGTTSGPKFCASLRSWNARGHFTRAILCENLQQKCRRPDGAPWSNPGLNSYRKNPSVWTRCLGNNQCLWPHIQSIREGRKERRQGSCLNRLLMGGVGSMLYCCLCIFVISSEQGFCVWSLISHSLGPSVWFNISTVIDGFCITER